MILDLPDNILVRILRYLDLKNFSKVQLLCRHLKSLVELDETSWYGHCHQYWLLSEADKGTSTWRQRFLELYTQWGRYIDCYARIKLSWATIINFCRDSSPRVAQSFIPGLSDDELDEVERHLGCRLPPDLRCSYRLVNGQRLCMSADCGLFGSYSIYGGVSDFLVPLRGRYHGDYIINTVMSGCIPIIRSTAVASPPILLCISSYSGQRIPSGWVFSVTSPHLHLPRSQSSDRLNVFLYARSFGDFLSNYAENITDCCVEYKGAILKYLPSGLARTGPFTVSVGTSFVREQSSIDPLATFFHYRITIRMDDDADDDDSCQLETRNWSIIDADGREEHVEGPGVVGEFPIMRPGAEYTWISSTHFETPSGTMQGCFTMRNLLHGSSVRIVRPPFEMKAPCAKTYELRTVE